MAFINYLLTVLCLVPLTNNRQAMDKIGRLAQNVKGSIALPAAIVSPIIGEIKAPKCPIDVIKPIAVPEYASLKSSASSSPAMRAGRHPGTTNPPIIATAHKALPVRRGNKSTQID
jgi:hypothetical protein